jgi:hypothetical protein
VSLSGASTKKTDNRYWKEHSQASLSHVVLYAFMMAIIFPITVGFPEMELR